MINKVVVLGAGTAGLMTALALQRKIPQLQIQVIRSPDIGVIGVGESTTPQFVQFLFEYLGIKRKLFYEMAKPTWKVGIHFIWGPREKFEFTFDFQFDAQFQGLSRPNGFYCEDDCDNLTINAALMSHAKAFAAQPNGGGPMIDGSVAFHLFNPDVVKTFEKVAVDRGITFVDAKVSGAILGEQGVKAIVLEDGRQVEADFFVDASGFRSELLGKALQTPFVSYDKTLLTDRAIVGAWDRTDDFIYPYTVAETMDAGWCWLIDHEHAINRGYVYSSRFISDEQAREEFQRKNPKIKIWDHVIKFRSGRYRQSWVGNVFAIGNACGFVEPLEATALMVASSQIQTMVTMLIDSQLDPKPRMKALYNTFFAELWDNIRDFLAIHYRFNTRLQNDFWTTCCNEVDVSPIQPLIEFYQENGPSRLARHLLNSSTTAKTQFGIEGFLTVLIGQKVPYRAQPVTSESEQAILRRHCEENRARANAGLTVAEALKYVKHPQWTWFGDNV
ncbi:MAG TPA: tryptophan 7-halogenase [Tepidisphaeraceae bacterium]